MGQTICTIASRIAANPRASGANARFLPSRMSRRDAATEHEHAKAVAVEAELIAHQLQHAEEHEDHPADGDQRPDRLRNTVTPSPEHRAENAGS